MKRVVVQRVAECSVHDCMLGLDTPDKQTPADVVALRHTQETGHTTHVATTISMEEPRG